MIVVVMKKDNIKLICMITFIVFIDQILKFLIFSNLSNGSDIIIINNFLKISYLTNTGAALGILGNNTLTLTLISIILIWYLIKEIKTNDNKLYIISLSLILSGALGNLIDRLFRGYVIDYISFTLFNKEMPIFNFADMMITFGVILIIYIVIKGGKNDKKNK